MKVSELVEEYHKSIVGRLKPNSLKVYERALEDWRHDRSECRSVKRLDIIRRCELARGRGPATARNYIAVTVALFNFGVEIGAIDSSPASKIKRPKGGTRNRWDDNSISLFCATATGITKYIFSQCLATGQRVSDVVNIRPEHVEERDGESIIKCIQQKTGTEVWTVTKVPVQYLDISANQASKLISNHIKKLGLKNLTLHGLRKTFACRLIENGGTTDEVRAALGHKTLQMAELYTAQFARKTLSLSAARKVGAIQ